MHVKLSSRKEFWGECAKSAHMRRRGLSTLLLGLHFSVADETACMMVATHKQFQDTLARSVHEKLACLLNCSDKQDGFCYCDMLEACLILKGAILSAEECSFLLQMGCKPECWVCRGALTLRTKKTCAGPQT